MLESNFGQFAVNLPWQVFDILVSIEMAAFSFLEAVTSSISKSVARRVFSRRLYQFSLSNLRFLMILIFLNFR